MSTTPPYISLALICGDAGVKTLPRLLASILCRSDGSSMVDEVVIGWNGTDEAAFIKALPFRDEAGAFHPFKKGEPVVPIRTLQQPWWLKDGADFAKARNETFAACTGEWVLWADTDDIISSSDDHSGPDGLSAINAVLRTYGRPEDAPSDGPSPTLADSLRQLPYNVNVVLAPYDYLVDETTHAAVVRQVMRRVVRRSAGFVWRNPIHEVLYPAGSTPMVSILATSLLVRHYPSESEQARLKRNSEIVQRMESSVPLEYADARHAFDVATAKIGVGDLAGADQALCLAIGRSGQAPEDGYRYRITRATLAIQRGLIDTIALQEAFFAIACMPQKPEAYFIASECLYLLGRWDACVKFYEMGKSFPYTPDPIDFVASRVIRPRAQAALALLELGQPERAIEEVELALREFPDDPMALNVKIRAMEDLARKRAIDGVLEAAKYLMVKNDPASMYLLSFIQDCVSLRGVTTLPLFQELVAAPTPSTVERAPTTEEELTLASAQPEGVFKVVVLGTTDLLAELQATPGIYNAQRTKEGHLFIARRPTGTLKEHIAFYCPHGYVPWDPLYVEHHALGGSETSAIYLAYELAQRGYRVTFYCPGGGLLPQVKNGVVWYSINAFDPAKLTADVLIAHRSPFILRNPDLCVPTFVWHQDNGYASQWQWSPKVHAKSKGSLHVSAWAKAGLVRELEQYGNVDSLPAHHVIGNGIRKEWCACEYGTLPARIRKRVIYASDPTRGLDTLLNCWPHVLNAHPDAELHLYVAWDCALSVIGDMATMGVPQVGALGTMRQKVGQLKNVVNHGRVPQHELTEAMLQADVYAYPGGMMPEGFGVALVQAAAAGMRMVVPDEGALGEVLDNVFESIVHYVPPVKSEEAAKKFLDVLIDMLGTDVDYGVRVGLSLAMRSRHAYSEVADRLIAVLRKEGLVK